MPYMLSVDECRTLAIDTVKRSVASESTQYAIVDNGGLSPAVVTVTRFTSVYEIQTGLSRQSTGSAYEACKMVYLALLGITRNG